MTHNPALLIALAIDPDATPDEITAAINRELADAYRRDPDLAEQMLAEFTLDEIARTLDLPGGALTHAHRSDVHAHITRRNP